MSKVEKHFLVKDSIAIKQLKRWKGLLPLIRIKQWATLEYLCLLDNIKHKLNIK